MKNGFTLVELSIVLVIIGMLVGGILVGQSLIESAKINSQIRQIQQFDIAVKIFQKKFKQLPGDSSFFTPNGNNNGCFNNTASACQNGLNLQEEPRAFWKHMSDSEMLKEKYSEVYPANGAVKGVNMPKGYFKDYGVNVSSVAGNSAIYSVLAPNVTNTMIYFYSAAKFSQTGAITLNTTTPGASVSSVASLDQKIDDGIPLRGRINAFTGGDAANLCFDTSNVNGPYLLSNPNAVCSIIAPLTGSEPL